MSETPTVALRDNKGKDELSYLLSIPEAQKALAHVFRQGAKKYTRDNWKLGGKPDAEYLDALQRHLLKHVNEGPFDPETGALHLAHAVWNLVALIELNIAPEHGVFNPDNTLDKPKVEEPVPVKSNLTLHAPGADPGPLGVPNPYVVGDIIVNRATLRGGFPPTAPMYAGETVEVIDVIDAYVTVKRNNEQLVTYWWTRFAPVADWYRVGL